jgi:hypothetical protein
MANMVLNRNYTLAGKGFMINFIKGQPTWVPPEMVKAAAGIGAEDLDGDKVDPLEDEAPAPPAELTAEERVAELKTAFELICERNNSNDFGGDNRPSLNALHKVVSFETTKKERDKAWVEWTAEKAQAQ